MIVTKISETLHLFCLMLVDQNITVGFPHKLVTDLILDSAAAGQFVAVTDGNYDGRLKEKRISPLQNKTNVTNQ